MAGIAEQRHLALRPLIQRLPIDDRPFVHVGTCGEHLFDLTGGWTVPQILIDGTPIGGYTELWRLDQSGALDGSLAAA